ncbi:NmrA family NAD(P)-binding protein [Chitinispirillales bacterium ANBcel5]|uniref:NmrA family NAD(P)-binding protein n=1 Tax=Cellulosispirillum alkaliphilum TaxID=3039283 RepID=UPI002A5027B4|nr:NmrA family NAD(P)-binding protein [Chitinispirillales bacterium ANBcel5]
MLKTTIMVTESTGMLEKEIIRQILRKGNCVKIAARDTEEAQSVTRECPVVHFDFENPRTYSNALKGTSSVFLGFPMNYPRVDDFLLPFMEQARFYGVKHIVGMGIVGENRDSPLMIAEKCLQNCGMNYTIIRPNLFMQFFKELASDGIRRDSLIQLPANDAKISFVDTRDVAETVADILIREKYQNQMFVLTGAQALNHYQIADILTNVTGRKIRYKPISHNQMWKILLERGYTEQEVEYMVGLYEIARHGWCENIAQDLGYILGREPTSFEQFAIDHRHEWV